MSSSRLMVTSREEGKGLNVYGLMEGTTTWMENVRKRTKFLGEKRRIKSGREGRQEERKREREREEGRRKERGRAHSRWGRERGRGERKREREGEGDPTRPFLGKTRKAASRLVLVLWIPIEVTLFWKCIVQGMYGTLNGKILYFNSFFLPLLLIREQILVILYAMIWQGNIRKVWTRSFDCQDRQASNNW